MKVLQFITSLNKGGAERMVVILCNHLISLGHEVKILQSFPSAHHLNQNRLSGSVELEFVSNRKSTRILRLIGILVWTARNRKELQNFDVIHFHLNDGIFFAVSVRLFSILGRIPCRPFMVFTCHSVGMSVPRLSRLFNKVSVRLFDAFVLMAKDVYWEKVARRKILTEFQVIPNGIDVEASSRRKRMEGAQLNEEKKSIIIGTLSRLNRERSPENFLFLFYRITQKSLSNEIRFVIGGAGPLRSELEILARSLKLEEKISFEGLVTEAYDFLDTLDIYISVNVREISGIAALEAVSRGIPVVGIQMDKEYLARASDLIWSTSDLSKLAERVLELSTNATSRIALAKDQLNVLEQNFSGARMTESYLKTYNLRGEKLESE